MNLTTHIATGKISVIIPTFNRQELLGVTLDNILRQSLPPEEIIVVDDHSQDGTTEYVRRKFEGRVSVLLNKGKGPGAARNTGMAAATGSYIKFFDSDDLMTSNMLKSQYDALLRSEARFVYSPYFFASQSEEGWHANDHVLLNYFPFDSEYPLWHYMMIEGLFITIPGMLFKKDFLEEIGPWREDVIAYEDWDYLFRISLVEPFPAHTNSCSFLYRLHGGQTTDRHFSNDQRDLDKKKVMEDLYANFIRNDDRFTSFHRLFFRNKLFQLYRITPPGHALKDSLLEYNTPFQSLAWLALRMKLKFGRIKTGTNWQPCHGPLESQHQWEKYLEMVG